MAAAGRSHPRETVSGDICVVHRHEHGCRIAVVDGLGHGPEAATAARAAATALDVHPDLDPPEALRVCHEALTSTRGAAIAVAQIDLAGARLVYAGVGNVEARLLQAGREQRLVSFRGIVGRNMPRIRAFDFTLDSSWLLLMHTDGVSARFESEKFSELGDGALRPLVEAILQQWGRSTDDATVVAARPSEVSSSEC